MGFPAFTITAAGIDMQAQAELGGTLTFTRIALGAGAAATPATATALSDQRLTADIQQFLNMGGGNVRLRSVFSNTGLLTGFSMTEVGVFALDPTTSTERLHSYATTSPPTYPPDYMPAEGGSTIVEQIFDAIIAIGTATNVTAVIDDTVMIATKEDATWGRIAARTIYTTGTAQTHTFQARTNSAIVEGIGGGGGGGGGGVGGAGSGGGAGGYFKKRLTSLQASLTYTVGGGGGASASGGTTTVVHDGVTYTATGGSGGTSSVVVADGANGGTASNGDINIPGGPGFTGFGYTDAGGAPSQYMSGNGGSSLLGAGGKRGSAGGSAGTGYGSGGGGGGTAGGAGAGGVVIVTEYF